MTPHSPLFQYTGRIFWIGIVLLASTVLFIFKDHIFQTPQGALPAPEVVEVVPESAPESVPVTASPGEVALQTGLVEVLSEPAGAMLSFDGKEVGRTPLMLSGVSFASHRLSLKKRCYGGVHHDFSLSTKKQVLSLTLEPVCGDLAVTSIPAGAVVRVNGKKRGVTPYTMTGVRGGGLAVSVQIGKASLGKDVLIQAGHQAGVSFNFTRPPHPEHRQVWQDWLTGMSFVWVKGGCYPMGNPQSDLLIAEREEREKHKVSSFFQSVFAVVTDSGAEEEVRDFDIDEGPVHEVCLDGLWVGQTEVTNDQYMGFSTATGVKPEWLREGSEYNVKTGENEYYKTLGGASLSAAQHPVVGVSWQNVVEFSQWFSAKTGYPARLLSEAEWEYVCRSGGQDESFAGGGEVDAVAWYMDNSDNETHGVAGLQGNGLGLFDLSGNVWEWTLDVYDPEAYGSHSQFNPVHNASVDGAERRVVRGGSWRSQTKSLRCTARFGLPPGDTNVFLGFRIVMPVGDKK